MHVNRGDFAICCYHPCRPKTFLERSAPKGAHADQGQGPRRAHSLIDLAGNGVSPQKAKPMRKYKRPTLSITY